MALDGSGVQNIVLLSLEMGMGIGLWGALNVARHPES
jgi:hypothetical protein